jgi:hypothetical protein
MALIGENTLYNPMSITQEKEQLAGKKTFRCQ